MRTEKEKKREVLIKESRERHGKKKRFLSSSLQSSREKEKRGRKGETLKYQYPLKKTQVSNQTARGRREDAAGACNH